MKKIVFSTLFLIIGIGILLFLPFQQDNLSSAPIVQQKSHWLLLERKSNREHLFYGVPGEKGKSELIKSFSVKSGVAGEKPTPLPQLLGKRYWLIIDEEEAHDNPETGPYFLTLDVPSSDEFPYGPTPYLECSGQCDWEVVGYFGLHGTAGNPDKLSADATGTSGCIRHSDEDITYLYNLLEPEKGEVRYYIEDI